MNEAIALLSSKQHCCAVHDAVDEARQQLENPVYYGYWRNTRASRLRNSGKLKGLSCMIFRPQSSSVTTGESVMPATMDMKDSQPFLKHENGHDHLYSFSVLPDATQTT